MNASSLFRSVVPCFAAVVFVAESRGQDVAELVQQLGAPRYQVRERAYHSLRKELTSEVVLDRLRGPFPDAEIDQRANQLREEYLRLLKPADLPTLPWIDMLPATKYPGADKIMRDCLKQSGGHGRPPLWGGDIEGTRLWVRELVNQSTPRDQIVSILDAMAKEQKKTIWYKDYTQAVGK